MTFSTRDVVSILSGRFRGDYAIRSCRYINRGRAAGKIAYSLAPMVPRPGSIGVNVFGSDLLTKCSVNYSPAEVDAALQTYDVKVDSRNTAIEKRTEDRQEITEDMQVRRGDSLIIRSDQGNWPAEVSSVNFSTGKIGIRAPYARRSIRWISPKAVVRVIRRGAQVWPVSATAQPAPTSIANEQEQV
jgi:hypothetical protein